MSVFMKNYRTNETIETYKNCVYDLFERNGYDDSDFYAIVWDEAEKSTKLVEYATTRFYCSGCYAKIDISNENLIKVKKYKALTEYKYMLKVELKKIEVNKMVTVVKGRKVKVGTVGKVIGIYNNEYDRWNSKVRLLLDNGEKVYTYEKNLEVVNPSINEKMELKFKIMEKYGVKNLEI